MIALTTPDRTDGGDNDQGHNEGCREGIEQGQRQELHELASGSRPEQQWQEYRQRGRSGGDDRPGHALGCFTVCGKFRRTFREPAVGVFGDNDGAIDQHPDRQNQGEQHHHVQGVAIDAENNQRHQECAGNGHADHKGAAQSQAAKHQHHHQQSGDQHVIEQVVEHFLNLTRFVLGGAHFDTSRPIGLHLCDHGFHIVQGMNDVGADALFDFQSNGGFTIHPGAVFAIFVRQTAYGDVLKQNHLIAVHLHRQLQNIRNAFNQAWNLDGKSAGTGIKVFAGDQLVVIAHQTGKIGKG